MKLGESDEDWPAAIQAGHDAALQVWKMLPGAGSGGGVGNVTRHRLATCPAVFGSLSEGRTSNRESLRSISGWWTKILHAVQPKKLTIQLEKFQTDLRIKKKSTEVLRYFLQLHKNL